MATTYNPQLLTPRDRMRHTLADIADPPLRIDTEYDALLREYSEPEATMRMAESLAAQFAQDPSSTSVGGVSVSFSSLVSTWLKIADNIRKDLPSVSGSGSTMISTTVTRGWGEPGSEYRRPVDWVPEYEGDAW